MLKRNIEKILRRSHFWRDVGFDELSELYVSNMLRSVALTIFMVFVPFYLYQNHYSAPAIFGFYGCFFVARVVSDILAAYSVARFGPKHSMIISCVLQIMSASLLLSVPQVQWHIVILALPFGAAASFFFISYHTVFSKIKHTSKAGHELGHMQTYERIGYLVGPIIGGVVGSIFGAQYIFLMATLLLFASLWPLFQSSEPTRTHQKLNFKDLHVNKIKYDLLANAALGVENTLCMNIWSLYVAVFVLSGAVYAQLGGLSAIGVLASVVAAKFFGRMTDTSLARPLLRLAASLNAVSYLVRPWVQGVGGVLAVNVFNETVTTAYRMPFMKGIYAAADDLPGQRIVYLASMEATNSIAKATVWFMLAILATTFAMKTVIFVGFAVAILASLLIMKERFAVYNTKQRSAPRE